MPVRLNRRELATVLAALRHWQQDWGKNEEAGPIIPDHFEEGIAPLTVPEIDELCAKLNFGTGPSRAAVAPRRRSP